MPFWNVYVWSRSIQHRICAHIYLFVFPFHAHLSHHLFIKFYGNSLNVRRGYINNKKKTTPKKIFRSFFSISFAFTIWHSPYLQVHYVHEINKRTCMHFTLDTIFFSSLFISFKCRPIIILFELRTLTLI